MEPGRLSAGADGSRLLLAVLADGEVAGYAGMRTVLDEGYISNIAVSPALRKRGLGMSLVQAMLREGERRRLSFLTLEVRVGNGWL